MLGLQEGPYTLASPGVRRVYTNCCGSAKKGKIYIFCLKKLGTASSLQDTDNILKLGN